MILLIPDPRIFVPIIEHQAALRALAESFEQWDGLPETLRKNFERSRRRWAASLWAWARTN